LCKFSLQETGRTFWRFSGFPATRATSPSRPAAAGDRARAGLPGTLLAGHLVFSKISRPISMRRISLVPAPIS
jgi:hypothetical protein